MTDMTLAEREQLEALITHAAEQTRTEAEKAEAQARLEAQIADTRVMLACENGAARVYLDGVDLGTLVPHPEGCDKPHLHVRIDAALARVGT